MNARNKSLIGSSGALLVALVGLLSTACSGDDNSPAPPPTDAGPDATTAGDGGEGDATTGGDAGDAEVPTEAAPSDASDAGDAGSSVTSDASDAAASTCNTAAAIYPTGSSCTPCGTVLQNSCSTFSIVKCQPFIGTVPDASF